MSPAKFNDEDHARKVINGTRPSPLKINKDSHSIHKPCSSSIPIAAPDPAPAIKQRQQQQPVIIYTHSPKVIHTQARDFMALVQKLTGPSRQDCGYGSNGVDDLSSLDQEESGNRKIMAGPSHDNDNESSSVLTDEINGGGNCDIGNSYNIGAAGAAASAGSNNSMLNLSNPYFGDIPLFTPNGTDFFCSPSPVYRFPDTVYPSPNMSGSLSPSFLEFMKGLPEY